MTDERIYMDTPLPAGFPGRKALADVDITTYGAADGADLMAVPGVGAKTMVDIHDSLAAVSILSEHTPTAVTDEPVSCECATDLPLDFPCRRALLAAGVTTVAAVRALGDPTEIPGVGHGYVTDIREACGWGR